MFKCTCKCPCLCGAVTRGKEAAQQAAENAAESARTAAIGAKNAAAGARDKAQDAVQKLADDFNEGKITRKEVILAGAAVLLTGIVVGMIIAPKKVQIHVENNGIMEENLAEEEETEE